ncbi:helix-turn-helix transcriptional regulator [Pseudonocardia acidicola]|uniref:helix-turn-helix transcriptional regulator n=1 Tax=Pseudonocardia acidicola TaxID=2724939 RepID=UPI001EF00910|nr:transcriptional regulator [Pseudonocardia acidicola]
MHAFIRRARRPVTRDEAAASVGISRKLAAFHLDKLVQVGLLRAHYEPVGGTRKVGRRPKVYEPSGLDIQVTVPRRQHDVLADILLDGVLTAQETENPRDAVVRVAHRHGSRIGAVERERARPGGLGLERALTLAAGILERQGFEPAREDPTCIRLRNCPFHPLAAKAPQLVCGINHAFLTGMLTGLDSRTVEAVLDPHSGECCVELRAARRADTAHHDSSDSPGSSAVDPDD